MLIGTIAFASKSEISGFNEPKLVTLNFNKENLTFDNISYSFQSNQLSQKEFIALADCTLRGKFTIIFPDGSKYSWEGTLTILGQSCVEFLKQLMKE
jgi:hypothetical protein